MPPSTRRPQPTGPKIRRDTIRVAPDIAGHLRAGHPFVFRDALGQRPFRAEAGEVVEVHDADGDFVARGLFDPDGVVAVRVCTRDRSEILDADAWGRRVRAAHALRRQLIGDELNAYRVFHGEGDGLPGLTVDRYDEHLVVHLFSPSLLAVAEPVYDALEAIYHPKSIYEQRRFRSLAGTATREPAHMVRGALAPVEIDVREGDLHFAVDVTAPLGTGLFPDLRLGRRRVRDLAQGRSVLNLFSYTGGFSLYAKKGGAREVVSVDLAQKAHARLRRNLQLSGLSEQGMEFVDGDVFKVLAKMEQRSRKFDLVVVDPPSFGQSKTGAFSVLRDYRELLEATLKVCAKDSLLCCASNTMKLSLEDMDRALGEAAGRGRRVVRVVERLGLPVDFPVPAGFAEGNYLKFFVCAVA
jgi:23S rRNA (cytosine1962-C5)-methyltransferase